MKEFFLVLAVSAALLVPHRLLSNEQAHPDKVIAAKKITGRLVLFQEGDYLHVTVRSKDGKEVSFVLGNEGCFLATHFDQTLQIDYREVERYFPEGSGYYPANLIDSVTVEKQKAKWKVAESLNPINPNDELPCFKLLDEKLGKHNGD